MSCSAPKTWTSHPSKNCYEKHGAMPLWSDRPIPGKTVQGCKDTCSSWYDWYGKTCTAVTQDDSGNCWLRLSVTIYACENDDKYDTFVLADGGGWTKHSQTDCYSGAGGVPMPDVPYVSTSLGVCKDTCEHNASCDGIVVDKYGECWLRSSIHLERCDDDAAYDLYLYNISTRVMPGTARSLVV